MKTRRFVGSDGLRARPWIYRRQIAGPLTLIPDGSGDTVIFHVGAKGGAPINYSGPDVWTAGPGGFPTNYPTVTVGSKTVQGISGWSSRRHLTLPILSNAIAAWNSYNWVIGLIYRYPTFAGGNWDNNPGLFHLGKPLYLNQPGVYCWTESGPSGQKRFHKQWNAGGVTYNVSPPLETVDSTIHVDLFSYVASGGNTMLIKHDGQTSSAQASGLFNNVYDNTWRAFLGVYGYTPMVSPATDTLMDTWSDGVLVEAKMWIHSPAPTLGYIDSIYNSIIS